MSPAHAICSCHSPPLIGGQGGLSNRAVHRLQTRLAQSLLRFARQMPVGQQKVNASQGCDMGERGLIDFGKVRHDDHLIRMVYHGPLNEDSIKINRRYTRLCLNA